MNVNVKSKWVYGLIGLIMLAMAIWIVAGTREPETDNDIQVNQETYTVETSAEEGSVPATETAKGYYLVKAVDDTVKVFWIDESGEHLHRKTTIAYSLLSSEDQEMLDEGVKLENDDELAAFLENYDS